MNTYAKPGEGCQFYPGLVYEPLSPTPSSNPLLPNGYSMKPGIYIAETFL